jgi:hypothetical protein
VITRLVLAGACLLSAFVHAGLALPYGHAHARGHGHAHAADPHLHNLLVVRLGFGASAALLFVLGIVLTARTGVWAARAVALLLAGLIAGYAVTRAVAVPGLEATPEPLDGLGVVTKCVELAGLAAAARLLAAHERPRLVGVG